MTKIGIAVRCAVCGQTKKPRGRSEALGTHHCRPDECDGYWQEPKPGDLWPGETDVEFVYPCGDDATERLHAPAEAAGKSKMTRTGR